MAIKKQIVYTKSHARVVITPTLAKHGEHFKEVESITTSVQFTPEHKRESTTIERKQSLTNMFRSVNKCNMFSSSGPGGYT